MFLTLALSAISIAAQTFLLVLAADFVSGLFHWAEDTWGTADTPIWGPVFVRPNLEHHSEPSAMMRKHWLANNGILFSVTLAALALAWAMNGLSWQLVVFALTAGMGQQAHRFAHAPRHKLPGVVRFLQRLRILQTAQHHWQHHKAPHNVNYCPLTPWLNPVLDGMGFWRGLERLLSPLLGPVRTDEEAV